MAASIDGISHQDPRGSRPRVVEVILPDPVGTSGPGGSRQRPDTGSRAEVEPEQVVEASRKVEQLVQIVHRNLQFREDENSGRVVVSVIDTETGEIIRQIPPERMVRMADN